jgi:hypothetical protein
MPAVSAAPNLREFVRLRTGEPLKLKIVDHPLVLVDDALNFQKTGLVR